MLEYYYNTDAVGACDALGVGTEYKAAQFKVFNQLLCDVGSCSLLQYLKLVCSICSICSISSMTYWCSVSCMLLRCAVFFVTYLVFILLHIGVQVVHSSQCFLSNFKIPILECGFQPVMIFPSTFLKL